MYSRHVRRRGPSTELMPSIMGEIDDRLGHISPTREDKRLPRKPCTNSFANLSPNVQKILANVSDQELNKNFSSEETLVTPQRKPTTKCSYSRRSPEKTPPYKSTENIEIDIISPSVQKMLSNLPDNELVIPSCGNPLEDRRTTATNRSFLYLKSDRSSKFDSDGSNGNHDSFNGKNDGLNRDSRNTRSFLHFTKSASSASDTSNLRPSDSGFSKGSSDNSNVPTASNEEGEQPFPQRPLGSYLHNSTSGIASRTPVGRKHIGGYLQVPSESSVGSTTSSEVSRPVSLTSLGSCSSSGSSGMHQPSSAYMASAESLDSDPEPTGSQGSADSGIAEQPNMSPDQRVLLEVLDSETVYVSDLQQVIQGYLHPWRSELNCPLQQHLPHLFSNLETIYEFNKSFLEELKEADYDPSRTADVFLHNDEGFSIYTEYCTNYPRTMSVLIDLMRDEKMANLFREKQILLEHALPLGSYLLKPVQRILKYHLLLQRLSKHCDPLHKTKVDQAVATMANVATHINNMKKKHEHDLRVQEIQSQLYGWPGPDLTTLGELIAEGTFRVRGARGRRHVFLFDKLLLMAKGKQDGGLTYKSHIMCSNLMLLEQVKGEPLCFHILPFDNPRLQSTLRARSLQHKREWTLQLKRVILENYSAVIPSHARQLVMQLGQDIVADVESTNERWSPLKQYSTPQYLERRSRIRNSRDLTNRRSASQDRFPSLSRWRRKSEPFDIQQYNTKTVPRKITKIKKTKDSRAKFYTDLSDSENYEVVCESTDSLNVKDCDNKLGATYEDIEESCLENEAQVASTTLEQVVSDLLMQNQDFQKILNRRKNVRDSEPGPVTWIKPESENLPPKSDSLPRSFQLNEQGATKSESLASIASKVPDVEVEEEDFDDSILEKDEHPEHKIYRKSTIRFSLLQRFRAMISEEQKKTTKLPTYKQGSKSMGAKIANPDYADPQKLFPYSPTASQISLTEDHSDSLVNTNVCDLIGEPGNLDLSLNENEVLNEFDRRLRISKNLGNSQSLKDLDIAKDLGNASDLGNATDLNSVKELKAAKSTNANINDTGQTSSYIKSSRLGKFPTMPQITTSIAESKDLEVMLIRDGDLLHPSKSLDSYYETIMEKNLSDGENISDDFGSTPETSISSNLSQLSISQNSLCKESSTDFAKVETNKVIKRPTKAPPPIPVKPARLSNSFNLNNSNTGNLSGNNLNTTNVNNTNLNTTTLHTTNIDTTSLNTTNTLNATNNLNTCNNTSNKITEIITDSQNICKSKSDSSWFSYSINTNNKQSTLNGNNVVSTFFKSESISKRISTSYSPVSQCHNNETNIRESAQAKGWVKMIVDRFE